MERRMQGTELLMQIIVWSPLSSAVTAVAGVVAAHAGTLPGGCRLFFSPVRGADLLDTAVQMIEKAGECVFISMPFGLDGEIVKALNRNASRIVEYGLVNTTNRKKALGVIDRSTNAWYASPTWIKEYDGRLWDARAYGNHKIHVKSIVTDPWSDTARVLIGSANFSDESVARNDENAIFLEGDRRTAAIVATEFLRMFDHYKFRDYVARAKKKTFLSANTTRIRTMMCPTASIRSPPTSTHRYTVASRSRPMALGAPAAAGKQNRLDHRILDQRMKFLQTAVVGAGKPAVI